MKKGLSLIAYLGLVITYALFIPSCSKDAPKPSIEQRWSKEIYDNMKKIYLWNDALPSSFAPSKYATAEDALDYLIGLKINPRTNEAIDRYSFLDKIGNLSTEIGQGLTNGDYGFMILADANAQGQPSFFVNYVYANSSAGKAGVKRTYEIIAINGSSDVHPGITPDGKHLDTKSTGFIKVINALFYSQSAKITFRRPDGTRLETTLTTEAYTKNSILFEKVYSDNKIGYIVFNQFLGKPAITELNAVIEKFQSENLKHVIIDLRYNGGGDVATCTHLSNLLAPSSANGSVMFKYRMNSILMSQEDPSSLVTYFKKTNTLEPESIYFIVGGNTASASELLINNLRPYYQGKLFLIGSKTYGKPCGFWATPIGYTKNQAIKEGYDLYAVSFESVNANDEGDYYLGMQPGSTTYPGIEAYDSPKIGWGENGDECLEQALYRIANGTFKLTLKARKVGYEDIIDRQFKGMIDFRKH